MSAAQAVTGAPSKEPDYLIKQGQELLQTAPLFFGALFLVVVWCWIVWRVAWFWKPKPTTVAEFQAQTRNAENDWKN